MYESAVFGPRPLPIAAERDSNPLLFPFFSLAANSLPQSALHTPLTAILCKLSSSPPASCCVRAISSHLTACCRPPSSLPHTKRLPRSASAKRFSLSHGAPYLPLLSPNLPYWYITPHHIYLSPLGKRSHGLGCIVRKYLGNLHIYHQFRLNLQNMQIFPSRSSPSPAYGELATLFPLRQMNLKGPFTRSPKS